MRVLEPVCRLLRETDTLRVSAMPSLEHTFDAHCSLDLM
jgi:hypothetical protein